MSGDLDVGVDLVDGSDGPGELRDLGPAHLVGRRRRVGPPGELLVDWHGRHPNGVARLPAGRGRPVGS